LDKRAPRAGHRFVGKVADIVSALLWAIFRGAASAPDDCSAPPAFREWKGGAFGVRYTRQPRLSAPFVRMTSPERVKVYPCYLQSAAWFVVEGVFPMAAQSCAAPGLVFRSSPPAHRTRGLFGYLSVHRLPSRVYLITPSALPFPRT